MSRPSFSILLPSRNRLELLKYAIDSVVEQCEGNLEIVVSDNASDEDYETYLRSVTSVPIRYIRGDTPISVTANWNRALQAATGDYVVMLGDDDALTPGFIRKMTDVIENFEHPDVVYCMAYHYAYPNTLPGQEQGYFCTVNNSSVFDISNEPFLLDVEQSRHLARQALRFRHLISFNAQHFVWRRDFMKKKVAGSMFFQSPYPDFFACFMTFLTAEKIAVVPSPEIIVGISRKSFGYFHANNQEDFGFREFFGEPTPDIELAAGDEDVLKALRHPGTGHYRNWLIATLFVKRNLMPSVDLFIDLRRYRRIQIYELAQSTVYNKTFDRHVFRRRMAEFEPGDQDYAEKLLWTFMMLDRVKTLQRPMVVYGIRELLNIHHPPKIYSHDIGAHENIMDAYRWLESR
ncbi:glycosyltransferase family 2 protein [Paraburkholderia sediminicola]|uniref:glycosyltransferase family 2 protein n=1 Tax=Paraburkholderia sediminicola TaxID=458836 RepID=UPI0038B6EFF4